MASAVRLARGLLVADWPRTRVISPRYDPRVVAYVALMCVAAASVSIGTYRAPPSWAGTAIVGVVILLMSRTAVRTLSGVDYTFTASMMLHIGGAITFGPACAVVTGIAEPLGAALRRPTGWFRTGFNVSNTILSTLTALGVFEMFGSPRGGAAIFAVAAGMGLADWAVNHAVLGVVILLTQGRTVAGRLARSGAGMAQYYVIYAVSALALPPLYGAMGVVGLFTVVAPLLAAQLFLVVMERHSREHEEERQEHLTHIEAQNRFLNEQNIRVERAHKATLVALTNALDARDHETEGHSRRVVELSRCVGSRLGLPPEKLGALTQGALLHDIGKIGVPDAILHKPGSLTEEEWAIMRTHPGIGYAMVRDVELLQESRLVILHHHERWDGSGYPRGLAGAAIDAGARVFAVADAVDAMTHDRPYRRALSLDHAREELRRLRAVHFDPDAVDALLSLSEDELLAITALRARPGLDLLPDSAARERYLSELGLGATHTPD